MLMWRRRHVSLWDSNGFYLANASDLLAERAAIHRRQVKAVMLGSQRYTNRQGRTTHGQKVMHTDRWYNNYNPLPPTKSFLQERRRCRASHVDNRRRINLHLLPSTEWAAAYGNPARQLMG